MLQNPGLGIGSLEILTHYGELDLLRLRKPVFFFLMIEDSGKKCLFTSCEVKIFFGFLVSKTSNFNL